MRNKCANVGKFSEILPTGCIDLSGKRYNSLLLMEKVARSDG